jgi:hypothetical protein
MGPLLLGSYPVGVILVLRLRVIGIVVVVLEVIG